MPILLAQQLGDPALLAAAQIPHPGIHCDGCKQEPIIGIRHKCLSCEDFDFCTSCLTSPIIRRTHDINHAFFAVNTPQDLQALNAASSGQQGVLHPHITCDACAGPVRGLRHKCLECEDYDFCDTCFANPRIRMTHDTSHAFFTITFPANVQTYQSFRAARRGVEHPNVTCDACQEGLWGVRWKCMHCDDYDLCERCVSKAFVLARHGFAHRFFPIQFPGHFDAFLAAKAQLVGAGVPPSAAAVEGATHEAACDGCNAMITGPRHKCLVCEDFDFCSSCVGDPEKRAEHDPSHPLWPVKEPGAVGHRPFDAARRRMGIAIPSEADDAPPPYHGSSIGTAASR